MDKNLDIQIMEALKAYWASGVEDQVDYQKFYLYSIVTHSTAIEGPWKTSLNGEIAIIDKTDMAACYRLTFQAHFRLVTIHPWVDGNGRTTRLVINMIQRQLSFIPSIVRREDKGEYIQSLVDSRENDDSIIAQDVMLRHHIANLNRRTLQYQENDTVNLQSDIVSDTVNSQNDTVSELKEGLKRIYIAIQNNLEITHSQLMEIFNISESTAKRATRDLKKLGYIEREGSDKTGRWVILK